MKCIMSSARLLQCLVDMFIILALFLLHQFTSSQLIQVDVATLLASIRLSWCLTWQTAVCAVCSLTFVLLLDLHSPSTSGFAFMTFVLLLDLCSCSIRSFTLITFVCCLDLCSCSIQGFTSIYGCCKGFRNNIIGVFLVISDLVVLMRCTCSFILVV